MTDGRVTSASNPSDISIEMSARNTGLSIQRTRMSADRTLMSVIRTSLSLISFGFTIAQIFQKLTENNIFKSKVSVAPHFGIALVILGVLMLVMGIVYHAQFMLALRDTRKQLVEEGLIHGESPFPLSLTLITAVILLAIGITAAVSMMFHVGPFE